MPAIQDATMTTGLRAAKAAPAPAPPMNVRYLAVSNTLRWIQDGRKAIELFRDDSGQVWAIPQPVLAALVARAEVAVAGRITVLQAEAGA